MSRIRWVIASLVLCLAGPGAAAVTPYKVPFHVFPVDSPGSLLLHDMDGDGRADVVTASSPYAYASQPSVTVSLGAAGAIVSGSRRTATSNAFQLIAAADFTGDHKADLLVVSSGTGYGILDVLPGHGDGTFGDSITISSTGSTSPVAIVVGDFDGNGRLDVLDPPYVYLHRPDGTYSAYYWGAYYFGSGPVLGADMNGDGKTDLIALEGPGNTNGVLLSNGDGSFGLATTLTVTSQVSAAVLADVDGDGTPDLVFTNNYSASPLVSILRGVPGGTFGSRTDIALPDYAGSIAVGDVNGDGVNDIAVAPNGSTGGSGSIELVLSDGHGGFRPPTSIVTASGGFGVGISDIDGDGRADLVYASVPDGGIVVHLGRGNGTFDWPTQTLTTGPYPSCMTVGDLNGDGRPDLLEGNEGSSTVSVRLARSGGGFGPRLDLPVPGFPEALATLDVNHDGKLDVLVASPAQLVNTGYGDYFTGGSLLWLPGDGAGGLGSPTSMVAGDGPVDIAVTDLNGDGIADLVTADQTGFTISIFRGLVGGGFMPAVRYGTAAAPIAVRAGDLDGDGRPDLAVGCAGSSQVTILTTGVDGWPVSETEFDVPEGVTSVDVADVDADGLPDLVVGSAQHSVISILRGLPGSQFAPPQIVSQPGDLGRVLLHDVDGDGRPDLLVSQASRSSGSYLPNVIYWMHNGGGAGFLDPVGWGSLYGAGPLLFDDVDGDGRPDLLALSSASSQIEVYASGGSGNTGSGAPALPSAAAELSAPVPNPAAGALSLTFALPREGSATVSILDVSGREVARLVSGRFAAGVHTVRWDRSTRSGTAAPGVYFSELAAGSVRITKRIVLL